MAVSVEALGEANAPLWVRLFEICGSSCFCRYWHFEGNKNEWLARSVEEPLRNRDEQLALLRSGATAARGLLARDGDEVVGWMKLAPRAALPKLRRLGPYRMLTLGPDEGVYCIGCLLVAPNRRGQGAAETLIRSADRFVLAWGGFAVEAFPRNAGRRLHDEEAWMGTTELFAACGFTAVAGEAPYPVMRRTLAQANETGRVDESVQPATRPADSTRPSRTS